MFAIGIQARFGDLQSFDVPALQNMFTDDFVDMVCGDSAIPDFIGINNDIRSVFALIKAAGLVGAHSSLQTERRQFLLKELLEFGLAGGIAASARMLRIAAVSADKNVTLKLRHAALSVTEAACGE